MAAKPTPRRGVLFTIGTHNLHDEAGVPTLFADVIGFTEAIPPTIRARVRSARARAKARLAGYRVLTCPRQRDLVLVVRRRLIKVTDAWYEPVHGGIPKVTPHRGTWVVEGVLRRTGQPVRLVLSHRINAAFPPYKRGEPVIRRERWVKHTALDVRVIGDGVRRGRVVIAMGDLNTPRGVNGYPGAGVQEAGGGLDRLAVAGGRFDGPTDVLSRKGSDHPRLRRRVVA